MKNTLTVLFLMFWANLNAQVVDFYTKPTSVDSLNTINGQNYLVMSPHQFRMAFTEEQPNETKDIFQLTTKNINGEEWKVDILIDHLKDNQLVSPIGYDDVGGLFYNKVTEQFGLYDGSLHYIARNGKHLSVEVPFFKNKSPLQSGSISKDGQFMLLSLEGYYTYGVEDLYVVKRLEDGSWESVTNLGGQVNSRYQEVTPFLASDNKTLFFASNRKEGLGSFDIYYSTRLDDSWREWSTPINLKDINTSGSETSFCFVSNDDWAYFVRASNSDFYGDIMQVSISQDIVEDTSYQQKQEILNASAHFKVVDADTQLPIQASAIILEDSVVLESNNGLFKVDQFKGKTIEFKSKGHLSIKQFIDKDLEDGEHIVIMEPLIVGKTITLKNVLFHRASPDILDTSKDQLNLVVEMMNENPNIRILLKGHTDNQGNPKSNKRLSQERVEVVKAYLVFKGINKYRIEGKGFGGDQPIADNYNEETRPLNRRVEFEVIKN